MSKVIYHNPSDYDIGYPNVTEQHQSISVDSIIVDRLAGSTVVERICGPEPNVNVIADAMKKTKVRENLANYFISNQIVNLINGVVATQNVRVGEPQTTVDELIRAINEDNSLKNKKEARAAACEFIIPLAHALGLVTKSAVPLTTIVRYGHEPVTVASLSSELAAQSAVVAYDVTKAAARFEKTMSKKAYAQAFAEALRPIGFELHSAQNIQHILTDVEKAVYVRTVSASRPQLIGSMDDRWLTSPVVDELSRCYTFIQSALYADGDRNKASLNRNITLKNDAYTLDKEAPLVLAKLKGSRRYNFMSKNEYMSVYGKVTINDIADNPIFFVMYENASVQPVAQALHVFDDAVLPGIANNVLPAEEHSTKFIASALPSANLMSIERQCDKLMSAIHHTVESGDFRLRFNVPSYDEKGLPVTKEVVGADGKVSNEVVEVATFFSESIGARFTIEDESRSEDITEAISWMVADEILVHYDPETHIVSRLFRVSTRYKNLDNLIWMKGLAPDGTYVTSDAGMVLLLTRDFTPSQATTVRAQLVGDQALNTRVMNLTSTVTLIDDEKVPFNLSVAGVRVRGTLSTFDIGLQDISEFTKFVQGEHNRRVSEVIAEVYRTMESLEDTIRLLARTPVTDDTELSEWSHTTVSEQFASFIQQMRLMSIIETAKGVSPAYRAAVNALTQSVAMKSNTPAEVYRLRGLLRQENYKTYNDVMALHLVLRTCGLEAEYVQKVLSTESLGMAILRLS